MKDTDSDKGMATRDVGKERQGREDRLMMGRQGWTDVSKEHETQIT